MSSSDVIKGMNEQLKKDLMQLEGEIHQHAQMAHTSHTSRNMTRTYRR